MAKIRERIAAIGLGIVIAIGANLTVSAQAPVPVRKAPPPTLPANHDQLTPAQSTGARGTVTLHCGVAGLSLNLFSTAGLLCPDPINPGRCVNVILMGWNPAGPAGHDPRFDTLDFTCTAPPSGTRGFWAGNYNGISAEPGGTVTYGAADHSQICVSKFPTVVGIIPQNSELFVRTNVLCLDAPDLAVPRSGMD
jgi:hypothetical protein